MKTELTKHRAFKNELSITLLIEFDTVRLHVIKVYFNVNK